MPIGFADFRLKFMSFSEYPIYRNWAELIVPKDSNIKNVTDLQGKKIIALYDDIFLRGENSLKSILSIYNVNAKIIEFVDTNYFYLAKLIEDRRFDAALVSRLSLPIILEKFKIKNTHIVFKPITIHFAYRKDWIAKLFN
jgi:ABC-type amino acid transport substrate-binding protein